MTPRLTGPRRELLICILLFIAIIAVYLPVRHFEFLNFDDPAYVTANPHVFRGLTWQGVAWVMTVFQADNWHPLTWISHMLDCQLFGDRAGFHHLTNVVLHAANALLLYLFLRRSTGAVYRSAMVAALFALHPLHIESVAWIAERKDVLSTFFALLGLRGYIAYATERNNRQSKCRVWYALALLFYAASLMSKPMLVTLPGVLLLLDYWPLNRFRSSNIKALIIEKLPFIVLALGVCAVTVLAQTSSGASANVQPVSIDLRLFNAAVSYVGYLAKMFVPTHLAVFYPYPDEVKIPLLLGAIVVLAVVTVLAFRLKSNAPYLLMGWGWYLGTLLPVIGLVRVGLQSMADRYTYFPLVGIFIGIIWGANQLVTKIKARKIILAIAGTVVIVACASATSFHLQFWRNSETLFRRDLELYPTNNAMGHHNLGRALFARGEVRGAIEQFKEVVRILPHSADVHLNLANYLKLGGQQEDAGFHYRESLRLRPDQPGVYFQLGMIAVEERKLEEAQVHFLAALRGNTNYAEAHTQLGILLMTQGKPNEALVHLTAATEIQPAYGEGQYYLAKALSERKAYESAANHFRAAVKAMPENTAVLDEFAWLLASQISTNNLAEAVELAGRACEVSQYRNAFYLNTLGVALARANRLRDAIEITERAVAVAESAGQRELAAQLRERLAIYRRAP